MFGQTLATEILAAEGVSDIVNLTQHPLARINDSYAFCHHGGWYECSMQTHALCVGNQLKPSVPFSMFDYIECNFGNLGVADADNNRLCAANASVSYSKLWSCATGYGPSSGPGMLLASAQLADSLGINSAPTVLLNGQMIGHTLTLKAVCDAYTGEKPPGCQQADAVLAAKKATGPQQCHV
jgi:hypothetical protein